MSGELDEFTTQAAEWDAARARSQQQEVGWSQVAGCRRYMGYRLDGEWASDDEDNWRAIAGTALHGWLSGVRKEALERAGRQAAFEVHVAYRGIPGHADEVDFSRAAVRDYKFPTLSSVSTWDDKAVLDEKFVQVQGYAAAAVEEGILPEDGLTVALLAAPVDGKLADWRMYERPFDRSVADAAVERVEEVHAMRADGRELPRDKPAWWCGQFCEFVSLCRPGLIDAPVEELPEITDEELAAAVEYYGLAKETAAEADAIKKQMAPLVRGLRGTARGWKVTTAAPGYTFKEDLEQIAADYAASGLAVPMKRYPKLGALNVTRIKPLF